MKLKQTSKPTSLNKFQFSSVTQSCPTFWDPMNCSRPGLPVHHQLPEFTQTHLHRVSDAIQPSHPLSSPSPPAPNPSQHQGLFQWVNSLHEVVKVVEFQPQHQSFNEHPGLVSFRMDWLDLLAVQGTLKSLLQHHSSKASILWRLPFSVVVFKCISWIIFLKNDQKYVQPCLSSGFKRLKKEKWVRGVGDS